MSFPIRNRSIASINQEMLLMVAMVVVVSLVVFLTPASLNAAGGIVPGQEISITVPGHAEFSSKVLVAADGTIEYPLLAGVSLNGLTASEVRGLLLPLLMRYDSEPEVFVVISQKQLVRTQIYGAVERPGKYDGPSPLNLQQLLAMAGGVTEEANLTDILIIHSENGHQTERSIDLTRLFFADSLIITPNVADGDMVIVPRLNSNTSVRVYGAVQKPGEVYVNKSDNLYDVILRAGGFGDNADTRRVRILTRDGRISSSHQYDVLDYIDDGRTESLPLMFPGDVVIVPNVKVWRDFSWWVVWIRDIAVLASSLVVLRTAL